MSREKIRAIAHFDLDAFFVSVERMKNPSLSHKPLIVGGHSERGVVAACSYETRKYGVHSAMPMKMALQLCPQAIVVPPGRKDYSHYSSRVTHIIAQHAPLYEKASIDEFYLDLTGLDKSCLNAFGRQVFGCYQWAMLLRKKIMQETGLPISFALSTNKLISKIAVDTIKPNGQIKVDPGMEQDFLAPMPIEKIPMVGKETSLHLHKMGIFTIAQLASTSRDTLRTFFGKQGQVLWERAHGIDHSPVCAHQEQKSISTENTFEENIVIPSILEKELLRLNTENARQLRKTKKRTSCIAIKIRFSDFETITRQMTIPPTAADDKLDACIKQLFQKYYVKNKPVRLLGVRYSHFTEEGYQLNLFENDTTRSSLYSAMDELKEKFGPNSIKKGRML